MELLELLCLLLLPSLLCIQTPRKGARDGPSGSQPSRFCGFANTRHRSCFIQLRSYQYNHILNDIKEEVRALDTVQHTASLARPRADGGCPRSREEELELRWLKLGQKGLRGCCRASYHLISIPYAEKRVLSEG